MKDSSNIEKLKKKKKDFDTNRTLCAGAFLIIIFITLKDGGLDELKTMPWFLILAVAVILIAIIGVFIYDSILIKKIQTQIKESEKAENLQN